MNPTTVTEAFNALLAAVLTFSAVTFTSYGIPWLKGVIMDARLARARVKAVEIVRALEQLKKNSGVSNDELAARARVKLDAYAKMYGLKIDFNELSDMIEAAVNTVNSEQGMALIEAADQLLSDAGNG